MRAPNRSRVLILLAILACCFAKPTFAAQSVPNKRSFWDNSKHWTTNLGPVYRDTFSLPSQFLACRTQFALCFHSGPEPYPCVLSPNGRSASCTCTVATSVNFTLITAILNYPVYEATIQACGTDGSGCKSVGSAPVCAYLKQGALIPGANVISTYDPDAEVALTDTLSIPSDTTKFTRCAKGPYAACMTAPCRLNRDGATATCDCPVFYGKFQLTGANAQCSLGGNLVPSAAYSPILDADPND